MSAVAKYSLWQGCGSEFMVSTTALPDELRPGEVLVAVDAATICGSDRKTVTGSRPAPAPCVLGHEQIGTVVAAGVGAAVRLGARVVWSVTASCGQCRRCVTMPQKCDHLRKYGHERFAADRPLTGGFATHCLLFPGTTIIEVPSTVPDEVASPASCATATAAAALAATAPIGPDARVLVCGAGMLAVTATAMLAQQGVDVTVYEPDTQRRRRAEQFGATRVTSAPVYGADVVFEFSGRAAYLRVATDALTVGSTLVLAGSVSPGPALTLDPERIVRNLLTVTGVHNYRPEDLLAAITFLVAHHHRYPFTDLTGGAWALDQLDEAFQPDTSGKFARHLIRPRH